MQNVNVYVRIGKYEQFLYVCVQMRQVREEASATFAPFVIGLEF